LHHSLKFLNSSIKSVFFSWNKVKKIFPYMQGKFYIPLVFILLSKKLLLLVESATITCLYRTHVI